MSMLEIVNIIFVAETSAVFGLLYFLSLEKGMILDYVFSFFGISILKEVWENEEIEKHNLEEDEVNIELRDKKPLIKIPILKKPLGACQTCTMVWIGVLTFLIFTYCLPLFVLISVVSNGLLIFRKIA
jgi:hypothetical protein